MNQRHATRPERTHRPASRRCASRIVWRCRWRSLWVSALAVACGILGPVHRAAAHDMGSGLHEAVVALGGYSLVTAVEQDRLVLGSKDFYVLLGSSEYHFVDVDEASAFASEPGHYLDWGIPRYRMLRNGISLGGYSPVALVDRGELRHGRRDLAVAHGDRRYYLASADERAAFDADPGRYTVDLTARLNATLQKRDAARAAAAAEATAKPAPAPATATAPDAAPAAAQGEPDGGAR